MKHRIGRIITSVMMAAGLIAAAFLNSAPALASSQGDLWIWGYGGYGQLGFGNNNTSAQATQLASIGQVKAVTGGCYHTLALKPDGTVWAWGYNGFGQLGIGSDTNTNVPTQVTGISDVVAISGGCYHSIAVKSDGTVWTWGNNGTWNLGIGSPAPDACRGFAASGTGASCSRVPIQAYNMTGIKSVSAGITVNLALANDGTLWQWGDFNQGIPAQVSGMSNVTSIATTSYYMLATKSDGSVWSWGNNAIVNGAAITNYVPQQITSLSNAVMVAANGWHSLVLKSDGTVWAWGRNSEGQIGTGTITSSYILNPTQVVGLAGAKQVAASLLSSYALKNDGTAYVWGYGYDGEYGDGSFLAPNATPHQINSLSNVAYITGGAYHVMAIIQSNQPPTVDAGGPYQATEGGSVQLNATGSDPENGALSYAWDLDNNGTFETPGQSVTFSAASLTAPDTKTVKVQITDEGGLTATDEATVNITYNFNGFLSPVDPSALNVVNAGRSIPIKFSLNGDQGMGIFEAGYPASQQVACDSSMPTSSLEVAETAGDNGLSYDAATDQYSYIWQTSKSWAGTCRQLTIKFVDGTTQNISFKFK